MNKVKFNRFERYIPESSENGLLYVSEDENSMVFKNMSNVNVSSGRNNIINGFKATLNGTVFTFDKGQLLAHVKKAYNLSESNSSITLNLYEPIWGIQSDYDFKPQTFIIQDKNKHYNKNNLNGADNSIGTIRLSPITSNTSFTGIYSYKISTNNDNYIKPTQFIINATSGQMPSSFTIEGSRVLHPYDDLDWTVLTSVTGFTTTGTYNVNTAEQYRHFRIKLTDLSGTGAINEWHILGESSDYFTENNYVNTYNYFLVKAMKENNEIVDMFIVSKDTIPVLDFSLNILDYCPIYEYKNINDYKNAKFYNKENIDTLDVSSYLTLANTEYYIWVTIDENDNISYFVSLNDNIPEHKFCKKILKFKTSLNDASIISNFYPKNSIAESYKDRFIIAEQFGTTGYRIWSDGWKEQWGNLANPTFPIAFDNIPVIVERGATNVTTTGMTIEAGYWKVKGY